MMASRIVVSSLMPRPASSWLSESTTSCTAACGGAYGFVVFIPETLPLLCPTGAFYAVSGVLSLGGRQSCAVDPGAGASGELYPRQRERKADKMDGRERLVEQLIRLD